MMSRMFRRVPVIYQNHYNIIKNKLKYKNRDAFHSLSRNRRIEESNRNLYIGSVRDSIQSINYREIN